MWMHLYTDVALGGRRFSIWGKKYMHQMRQKENKGKGLEMKGFKGLISLLSLFSFHFLTVQLSLFWRVWPPFAWLPCCPSPATSHSAPTLFPCPGRNSVGGSLVTGGHLPNYIQELRSGQPLHCPHPHKARTSVTSGCTTP